MGRGREIRVGGIQDWIVPRRFRSGNGGGGG